VVFGGFSNSLRSRELSGWVRAFCTLWFLALGALLKDHFFERRYSNIANTNNTMHARTQISTNSHAYMQTCMNKLTETL